MRDFRLVSGVKETLRALRAGGVDCVYIAQDAAPSVIRPVVEAAEKAGLPVHFVPTMRELGRQCGIDVACACAARKRS